VSDSPDIERQYTALHASAIVIDRSSRRRMTFVGARAAEALTGLVTNDVLALQPGSGMYAAALTPKGKIVADLRIFRRASDAFLVDTSPRAGDGWVSLVKKYVNPRLARYADVMADTCDLGVFGVRAAAIVAAAIGSGSGATADSTGDATGDSTGDSTHGTDEAALGALAEYAQVDVDAATTEVSAQRTFVARVPDLGLPGYELFVPAAAASEVRRRIIDAGAMLAGSDMWDIARVEAGRPEWGVDMDETTLAQEANMEELNAISFSKGCYTGQETVARVHFRGHVNRRLSGLTLESAASPPVGAEVFDATSTSVGSVRSAVRSPRLGGIALAMLRREIEPGAAVMVRWADESCAARVAGLPFPG
jgi:folate-binding protein YgfZ